MNAQLQSVLTGTSALTVALALSLVLTFVRRGIRVDGVGTVRVTSAVAIVIHSVHFLEEYRYGFFVAFPELLGQQAWSPAFFLAFNVVWLAIWILATAGMGRFPRASALPLWFLGITSTANGIAHPLMTLASGAYFPGLFTSIFTGIIGVLLLYRLIRATGPH